MIDDISSQLDTVTDRLHPNAKQSTNCTNISINNLKIMKRSADYERMTDHKAKILIEVIVACYILVIILKLTYICISLNTKHSPNHPQACILSTSANVHGMKTWYEDITMELHLGYW